MPVVRIPLQDWIPDKGEINNPGMPQVYGVLPTNDGWVCAPACVVSKQGDDIHTKDIRNMYGFHIHNETDTNLNTLKLWFFAGDDDDLYASLTADSLFMSYAKHSPGGFTPTTGSGWQFCSYGNSVVATEFTSHIQYALTPSTTFADMISYTSPDSYRPRARFVSTIKQHLLLGHIKFDAAPNVAIPTSGLNQTSYPSLVMWSATDNITRFGDPAGVASTTTLGSDYQDLTDEYGAITGVTGGEDAYIFKERAIYLMEGPPFQFRRIVSGVGTMFANSIVRYHDDVYFWGDGGPMRLRAGSSVPEKLGAGIIQRTVLDANGPVYDGGLLSDSSQYYMESFLQRKCDMNAFADYRGGYVVFAATTHDASIASGNDGISTKFLIYHVDTERWGFFVTNGRSLFFPRSISTYEYTPQTFGYVGIANQGVAAISAQEMGIELNGSYFLSGGRLSGDGEYCAVGKFAKDATLSSSTVPFLKSSPYGAPNIEFHLPYITFPVSEGPETEGSFRASSILKVRPIFMGSQLAYTVTVRSLSRFPEGNQEYHEKSESYDPTSTTFQDPNGWISLNTVEATHHKISIVLDNPTASTTQYRILSDAKNLITLEIEYSLGDSQGSAYYA